jgi:alanyl-tRNA synthetase
VAFLRFNRSIYHDPAFRILEVVVSIFNDYDFPFNEDRSVIPNQDDQSTLFVCSGMQRFKSRFTAQDKGRLSSLQSCIRTNDIDLVGDGSHLTHFQMLGNFSFGNNDYEKSCEMWRSIDQQILLGISNIHVHPSSPHKLIWEKMGYPTIEDVDCVWSDGTIGGYCSEMYRGNLEIGNLVNTLGHSTDVGFGWEFGHDSICFIVRNVSDVES